MMQTAEHAQGVRARVQGEISERYGAMPPFYFDISSCCGGLFSVRILLKCGLGLKVPPLSRVLPAARPPPHLWPDYGVPPQSIVAERGLLGALLHHCVRPA